ncbi:MAG: hypothetical protein ACF8XB_01440 [Planctomycetota bacterium JB042]
MIAGLLLAAAFLAPEATVRLGASRAMVGVPLPVEVSLRGLGRAVPEVPRNGAEFGAFTVIGGEVAAAGPNGATLALTLLPTRPGELLVGGFDVRLRDRSGRPASVRVAERSVVVESALAPGEAERLRDGFTLVDFEPSPASPARALPFLLLALLVAALALRWHAGRSRPPPARRRVVPSPPTDPTAAALDRLRELRAEVVAQDADAPTEARARAAAAADTVRRVLDARLDGRLLTRTTEELLPRLAADAAAAPLEGLLRDAELAKFAARPPARERLLSEIDAAIRWLEGEPRAPEGRP